MTDEDMRTTAPMLFHFDGPGVESNSMKVQVLAPSLIALNKLICELNSELSQGETNVQLYVSAFKPGSFGIELLLDTSIINQVKDFFTSPGVSALLNAHDLVGIILEIFVLKKWLKGRKPEFVKDAPDNDKKVELHSKNETLIVDKRTYNIYFNNSEIHEEMDKVAAPLEADGINEIKLSSASVTFSLDKQEYKNFIAGDDSKEFSENTLKNVVLLLKAPYFERDRKWKFQMGDQLLFATIDDVDFMDRVLRGNENFSTGDFLVADLLMKQSIENNKIITSYSVQKVMEHKKAPRQLTIPM